MLPENKHVLVTGGNGGIGVHLVSRFIDAGARVTIADLAKSKSRDDADFIAVDLSVPESVYRLGESLRATPPDIIVNLAGLNAFGRFDALQRPRLEALMQVNLLAPMQLVNTLLPPMLARGSGQIVNIGSVLGDIALPYFAAYATSKSGIAGFSQALRRELAGRGITVTCIAPRAVQTQMNKGAIEQFNDRSGAREDAPERVAEIIVDAISRDRAHVTIGWPERFFTKVNALFPSLVDHSLTRNRHVAEEILSAQSI